LKKITTAAVVIIIVIIVAMPPPAIIITATSNQCKLLALRAIKVAIRIVVIKVRICRNRLLLLVMEINIQVAPNPVA